MGNNKKRLRRRSHTSNDPENEDDTQVDDFDDINMDKRVSESRNTSKEIKTYKTESKCADTD